METVPVFSKIQRDPHPNFELQKQYNECKNSKYIRSFEHILSEKSILYNISNIFKIFVKNKDLSLLLKLANESEDEYILSELTEYIPQKYLFNILQRYTKIVPNIVKNKSTTHAPTNSVGFYYYDEDVAINFAQRLPLKHLEYFYDLMNENPYVRSIIAKRIYKLKNNKLGNRLYNKIIEEGNIEVLTYFLIKEKDVEYIFKNIKNKNKNTDMIVISLPKLPIKYAYYYANSNIGIIKKMSLLLINGNNDKEIKKIVKIIMRSSYY